MKVGITTDKDFYLFFNNGLRFNSLMWYHFLTDMGHDVTFLINGEVEHETYNFLNINNVWEKRENESYVTIKEKCREMFPQLYDFDVIFHIGLYDQPYFKTLEGLPIKVIYIVLGSIYHNDVHSLYTPDFPTSQISFEYDEIWISPHFKYCQEYYKIRFKTDKVFICPYFWREDLYRELTIKPELNDLNKLNVAIVEPNLEQAKNCLIPICICEKAQQYINNLKVFNSVKLKDDKFFKNFVLNLDLHKKGKMSVEGRLEFTEILSKHCNCVVSYVEDCDLNYVFLECFYMGVPLIHNSPMLKDYGYYYPRLSIEKGAQQIINVVKHHNREEYIKKHKGILQKYNISNPSYKSWVQARLEEKIEFDCD